MKISFYVLHATLFLPAADKVEVEMFNKLNSTSVYKNPSIVGRVAVPSMADIYIVHLYAVVIFNTSTYSICFDFVCMSFPFVI